MTLNQIKKKYTLVKYHDADRGERHYTAWLKVGSQSF